MFTFTNRTLNTLALALALALIAGGAPASARLLDLNANGSYAAAGSVGAQLLGASPRGSAIALGQTASANPAVRPNPDQQTQQASDNGAGRHVRVAPVQRCPAHGLCTSPDSTLTQGLSEEKAAALSHRDGSVASSIGSRTDGSSTSGNFPGPIAAGSGEPFQWGDAGIGAAGMLLLVSAAVGVAVTTRRKRHRVPAS
jgi:hypothetical protein